jgi:hypothetical protein
MKGLLIKDLMLLKNQIKFFIMFTLLCGFMLFINFNPGYVVGYMTLVFMMFTFTTISYDEFDNGFTFLFTLPISRKLYVREKYLFGILLSVAVWGLVFLAVIIESVIYGDLVLVDVLTTALTYLIMIQLFFAVNLPLQLKYGAEKGRIALIGVAVATFAVVFCLAKGVKYFDMNLAEAVNTLETMGPGRFFGILAIVCVFVFAISYFISLRIMEKKQF